MIPEKPGDSYISLSERDDAISRCLVEARLTAQPLPDFPDRLPDTLEQAYAIQAASIERWTDEVSGWKVARLSEVYRARFSAERLAGPVFRSSVHRVAPGSCTLMAVYEGGFAAVEAEFVLELGVCVRPVAREYSDDELIDMVAAAYCGAEIASSPMAVINERGPTSIVSDFGNNAGVLVGPEIPDWTTGFPESLPVTVTVDNVVAGSATVDSAAGDPVQALRFLVGLCARRGIELAAGTLVSAGAVTGVHDVRMSSLARVDFGPFGAFDITFEPKPTQHTR